MDAVRIGMDKINSYIKWLAQAYYISCSARLFVRFAAFLRKISSGSIILTTILSKDHLTVLWENSWIFKIITSFVRCLNNACSLIYNRNYERLHKSYIFNVAVAFSKRLHIFLGLFLAFSLIIPHKYWYNIYSSVAAIAFLIIAGFAWIIKGKSNDVENLDFMFVFFAFITALSVITSISPANSLRILIFYLTCFTFVFILFKSIDSIEKLHSFIEIALIGVTLCGAYGIFQAIKGVPVDPFLIDVKLNEGMPGRIFSTLDNPNNLAEVLVLMLPFYISTILNSKNIWKKLFYIFLMLPPLLALGLTYARSSWIAFVIGLILFVFLKNYRLIPLVFVAGLAAIPFLPESIFNRITTIIGLHDTTFIFRTLVYKTLVPMLNDFWITGVGLGPYPFMKIYSRYFMYTDMIRPTHSHNLFLEIWLEMGVLGIIAFLWLIFRVFKKSLLLYAERDLDKSIKSTIIAGFAALTGGLIIGLAEYIWFYPRVMLVFWFVFGVVITSLSIGKRAKNTEKV